MNKKIKLGLLTTATIVPVFSIVSCSSGWATWRKSSEISRDLDYVRKLKQAPDSAWKPNSYTTGFANTNNVMVIDLEKVENQFNLIRLIIRLMNLKPVAKDIDQYWNDFPGMKVYMQGIDDDIEIKFEYKGKTSKTSIRLDISKEKAQIIKGIDDYKTPLDKEFDVSAKGLDKEGNPREFTEVANHGLPLMSIGNDIFTGKKGIVRSLLDIDAKFALNLSKLVNLPKVSFDGFKGLMKQLDTLFNDMIVLSQDKDSPFYKWYSQLETRTKIGGLVNLKEKPLSIKESINTLKGLFIQQGLRK